MSRDNNILAEVLLYIETSFSSMEHKIIRIIEELPKGLITEIVNNIIFSGGKRIRPMLVLLSYHLFQKHSSDKIILIAAAVEIIHTATLLHDDVVDNSDKRRGISSANKIWDNKYPILVGDYLFAQSFELMVESKSLEVLEVLSSTSALIAEGEIKQLTYKKMQMFDLDEYIDIIKHKTAVLFASSMKVGAIIACAEQEQINNLYEYGYNIGVIFQMVDDILDYFSSSSSIGKNIGDDFFEGKVTLPIIISINEANSIDKEWIISIFCRDERSSDDLEKLLLIFHQYNVHDLSYKMIEEYRRKSDQYLEKINRNVDQKILNFIKSTSEYMYSRTH